jgi:hypothetical protein
MVTSERKRLCLRGRRGHGGCLHGRDELHLPYRNLSRTDLEDDHGEESEVEDEEVEEVESEEGQEDKKD